MTLRFPLPATHDQRDCCEWIHTDSELRFQQNLQRRGQSWPWARSRFQYQINSQGYRAPEFTDSVLQNSVWLLGCSWAFSVGVPEHQSLAHQLSELIGQPVINLSQGGVSVAWICDQFTLALDQGLRPGKVAIVWPEYSRWQFWGEGGPDQPRFNQDLGRAHQQDDLHCRRRAQLDHLTVVQRLEYLGVPLSECSWSQATALAMEIPETPFRDWARDHQHTGPHGLNKTARILAQGFSR